MPKKVLALTLTQPWATLLATGEKRYETRSWPTRNRGIVAIHAASMMPRWARELTKDLEFARSLRAHGIYEPSQLPLGCIVGMGIMVNCERTEIIRDELSSKELTFGDYTSRRYAYRFEECHVLPNFIPVRGALQFWKWDIPEDSAARDLYLYLAEKGDKLGL